MDVDVLREGCAVTMNRLADEAEGDWLLPLADDDLILPGCLEALLSAADAGDVVYAPPLVTGIENPWWFFQEPPVIPSFALIRAQLWHDLGGYDQEWNREEDRRLWTRALEAGAKFVRVNGQPTWVYRFHGGNKSINDGTAS